MRGYSDALDWLYQQTRDGAPRDPERMRQLLRSLELPTPPASVHVVGTNGKGTVATLIAAGYDAAGVRVGRFLSPHVEDFRERIYVGPRAIGEAAVLEFTRRIQATPLTPRPAFFELCLALALEHFARERVEIAVMEAGVGAKRDATLVVENVRATVITNVAGDHLDTLGPTLRDIACDKAAAIRPGLPVITAAEGEALEVIVQIAQGRGSPLYVDHPHDPLFALSGPLEAARDTDPLRYQNQRLAAATLRVLGNVPEIAITRGLETPPLEGRAERFTFRGRTVLLDGAHNPSAAAGLKAMLNTPYVLVFAALPKKLGEETLAVLEPGALTTIITQNSDAPSRLSLTPSRRFVADPGEALLQAVALCPTDACVVVTGSLYLAGLVRPYLRANAPALTR